MKESLALALLRGAIIEHCKLMTEAIGIIQAGGSQEAAAERILASVNLLLRESWRTADEDAREHCREAGFDIEEFQIEGGDGEL